MAVIHKWRIMTDPAIDLYRISIIVFTLLSSSAVSLFNVRLSFCILSLCVCLLFCILYICVRLFFCILYICVRLFFCILPLCVLAFLCLLYSMHCCPKSCHYLVSVIVHMAVDRSIAMVISPLVFLPPSLGRGQSACPSAGQSPASLHPGHDAHAALSPSSCREQRPGAQPQLW